VEGGSRCRLYRLAVALLLCWCHCLRKTFGLSAMNLVVMLDVELRSRILILRPMLDADRREELRLSPRYVVNAVWCVKK
jgi:hypothetical protein